MGLLARLGVPLQKVLVAPTATYAASRVRPGCRRHPGEALTQHEGLVLQHRVKRPQGGQRQLERAPPVRRVPSCTARCRGGHWWAPAVRGARVPLPFTPGWPLIRSLSPGSFGSPNAPGVLRCAIKLAYAAMIRRDRWRAAAAQERAGSGPARADSAWPGRYRRRFPAPPAIPGRRIMGTPKAYFIPVVHCGTRARNVIGVPRHCVMQNNKVRRRSSSQRRERDLGRGA